MKTHYTNNAFKNSGKRYYTSIKLGIIVKIVLLLCSYSVLGQFSNSGPMLGVGIGGLKADGLKLQSVPNLEIGYMYKYNFTERSSVRAFINLDFNSFTLMKGKAVEQLFINNINEYQVTSAPNVIIKNNRIVQHVDYTFIVADPYLDLSAGIYLKGLLSARDPETFDQRYFYNVTDSELLFMNETEYSIYNSSKYLVSDQIYNSQKSFQYGLYFSATGGLSNLKAMLRYEFYPGNYYSGYPSQIKLKESYWKIGLMYLFDEL